MLHCDSYGRVKHHYHDDSDFMYDYINYEYDEDTNRYYYLEESCNMYNPEMGGALVKRRIGKLAYMGELAKVKEFFNI